MTRRNKLPILPRRSRITRQDIDLTDAPALLLIERAITTDSPDGQCWPPTGLGDGWHLVRTSSGRTLWRRVSCGARHG